MTERIVSAAVATKQLVYDMPPPNRHHNILQLYKLGWIEHEQGFVTSEGRFVGRQEGAMIALAAGQITIPKKTDPQDELFSEDLW